MQSDILVKVDRAAVPEGTNLTEYTKNVNAAIRENYAFFGAKDKWSLWSREIYTSYVIVHVCDGVSPKYFKADMAIDTNGKVVFSNRQEVEMVVSYIPVTTVERESNKFEIIGIPQAHMFSGVILG